MNKLNSIVLEGTVYGKPALTEGKYKTVCSMRVKYERMYKIGEKDAVETSFFTVKTFGELAKSVYNLAHENRGVRIVGCLRMERHRTEGKTKEEVYILCEHAEFCKEV